jgi:alginate O-acetyltransferase complex protein AlgI
LRFDDPLFSLEFWSALLALYFLTLWPSAIGPRTARWAARAAFTLIVAASIAFFWWTPFPWLILGTAGFTLAVGELISRTRPRAGPSRLSQLLLVIGVAANIAAPAFIRSRVDGRMFVAIGATVLAFHAIAYLVDAYRGDVPFRHVFTTVQYLLHFPVMPGGPVLRYADFEAQHPAHVAGLAAFTYGMRRVIISVVKVGIVARSLAAPADTIFALPQARLTADAAWLGAVCVSLSIYFQWSGYADMAIGVGRMLGFRYPENFRRPYTAQSVRDFWRQWNITAITWLRDYLHLPIAGRDRPTARRFANIIVSFSVLGLWLGGGATMLVWSVYSGTWLALEALGLGAVLERVYAPLRHVYLVVIVMIGWVIFRADTAAHAVTFLGAMAGANGWSGVVAPRLLTLYLWSVLVVGIVGAGPLVPWISRWRVTLDAATAGILMMIAATTFFIWRGAEIVAEAIRPLRKRQ